MIGGLPLASALTGEELVPLEQNNQTVRTTISNISISGNVSNSSVTVGANSSATLAQRFGHYLNAQDDCGVLYNGTDQSVPLQACEQAALAAGEMMLLPAGTVFGSFIYDSSSAISGMSGPFGQTVLKMPSGKNTTVLSSRNFASLVGGSSNGGVAYSYIANLTIDGNRANNTVGDCIDLYGYTPSWFNLTVQNCPVNGLYTDWGGNSSPLDGMEGYFVNIKSDSTGHYSWLFGGPHDSQILNTILIDASLSSSGIYDGFHIVNGRGNAHVDSMHVWSRNNTYAWALNDDGNGFNNTFTGGSFFEVGQSGTVRLTSDNDLFDATTRFSLSGSSAATPAVVVLGSGAQINGLFACSNLAGQYAVQIGSGSGTAIQTYMNGNVINCPGGVANLIGDGGATHINVTSFNVGSYPYITGTPHPNDDDITIVNGGNYYADHGNVYFVNGAVTIGTSTPAAGYGLTVSEPAVFQNLVVYGSEVPTNGLYLPTGNTLGVTANSLPVMTFNEIGSAVNYLQVTAEPTGTSPVITAVGGDTTQNITLAPIGGGGIVIGATHTPADSAACTAGTLWWDASFLYLCTTSGTVKRATLSTF